MPPRVTATQTIHDGWGNLKRHTLDDGHTREIYDHGHAVGCLALDPARGTVLLVRQHRLPIALHDHDLAGFGGSDGASLEVPAGLIEEGEAPADTMAREMEEETGYRVNDLAFLADLYASPGSLSERMILYTAMYRSGARIGEGDRVAEGGGLESEGERLEVVEMTLADALDLLRSGGIRDLKTAFLLAHAAKGLAGRD